jgi:hypothetical protein
MLSTLKKTTESKSFTHLKRHWLTFAFLAGFVVDNFTLNRVDQLFDNLLLLTYVILAMLSLVWLYAGIAGKLPESLVPGARRYAPLLTQYAFGGLLSGMLIFYGRSGAWEQSWPFLLIILVVIYGNETIKDRSTRLVFNLAIFFVGLFSYVVLVIPVLTGYMGPWVFLGSGLLSLLIMRVFIFFLNFIIPNFLALQMRLIVFTIGSIFMGLNFLYFANIIPPIPLSLKEVGIYQSVVRYTDTGEYQIKYEPEAWWKFWRESSEEFHPLEGNNAFCFAKVFAPTKISTDIFHNWQYYDEAKKSWIDYAKIPYPIYGGKGDGYRGYTYITVRQDGLWRCSVETSRGQVLGREVFTVNSEVEPNELVTRVE